MDPLTAYKFLKPSVDQFTDQEMEEFRRLLNGEPKKAKPSRKADPIMSKAKMKKELMKSHFKSKVYK